MPRKPTQKQVDEMIETCINAVNQGKTLPTTQSNKFDGILGDYCKSKGIPVYESVREAFLSAAPQAILKGALNLGLITKPEHQRFIAQYRTLVVIESSLASLAHRFPTKFGELEAEIYGKPIKDRWNKLSQLSGLDFSKLLDLADKFVQASHQPSKAKSKAEKQRLERRANALMQQANREAVRLASTVREMLTMKFVQPNHRARLIEALRNPRDELTNRDMDKLWKTLEAHDRWQAKQKPIPRKRPMPR